MKKLLMLAILYAGIINAADVKVTGATRDELRDLLGSKPDIVNIISGNVVPVNTTGVDSILDNVNVRVRKDVQNTILMIAAARGYKDLVTLLLKAGADASLTDKNGKNAEFFANNGGHKDIVEALKSKGGMPAHVPPGPTATPTGADEKAALEAVKKELSLSTYEPIVNIVIGKGPDVYTTSVDDILGSKTSLDKPIRKDVHNTILMMAAARGFAKLVQLLLDAGANPLVKDKNGKTAEDFAKNAGHKDIVALLSGSKPSTTPGAGAGHGKENKETKELFEGLMNSDYNKIMGAIDSGKADVNAKDANGYTPLMLALQFTPYTIEAQRIVIALINHGADQTINEKDNDGHTALTTAIARITEMDLNDAATYKAAKTILNVLQGSNLDQDFWKLLDDAASSGKNPKLRTLFIELAS